MKGAPQPATRPQIPKTEPIMSWSEITGRRESLMDRLVSLCGVSRIRQVTLVPIDRPRPSREEAERQYDEPRLPYRHDDDASARCTFSSHLSS